MHGNFPSVLARIIITQYYHKEMIGFSLLNHLIGQNALLSVLLDVFRLTEVCQWDRVMNTQHTHNNNRHGYLSDLPLNSIVYFLAGSL